MTDRNGSMTTELQPNKSDVETEVVAKAQRRQFSAAYKARILEEADRCVRPGELGELCRREGLYSSSVRRWRTARRADGQQALAPNRRGPKASPDGALARENARLSKENDRLSAKLRQAELVIGVQKKLSQLLGISLSELDHPPRDGSN